MKDYLDPIPEYNPYKNIPPRTTSPADLRRKEQHIRDTYDRDPRASVIIEESLREGIIGQIPPARVLPLEIRTSIFRKTLEEIKSLNKSIKYINDANQRSSPDKNQ